MTIIFSSVKPAFKNPTFDQFEGVIIFRLFLEQASLTDDPTKQSFVNPHSDDPKTNKQSELLKEIFNG